MKSTWPAAFLLSVLVFSTFRAPGVDWPQWLGPQRDSVWRETGLMEQFPEKGLPVLWRARVGGGYSGPAVAGGRVYLTDRELAEGAHNPSDPFARGVIRGAERVLCLNEKTGNLVWQHVV